MGLFDAIAGGALLGPVGAQLGAISGRAGKFVGLDDDRREDVIQGGIDNARQRSGDISGLITQLQAQAQGTGPSLAQGQLQRAGNQALNQQQALAASARPGQGGLAQRLAAQNSSRIGGDLAQQAALLRLKEQQDAQRGLGQLLLGARGQDLGQFFGGQGLETFGSRVLDTAGQGLAFAMQGAGGA